MAITGRPEELAVLLRRLDSHAVVGSWIRDTEAEADIAPLLLGTDEPVRCFHCPTGKNLPGARLWVGVGRFEWKVTNIVPTEMDRLSADTYRAHLLSFKASLEPLLEGLSVSISEPVSEVGPDYWLKPEAVRLLHSFSVLANKSTGVSHPRDRARWNAFVIEANKSQDRIGANELIQILVEHENWPADKASELAILFENESSLLNDFANAS